MLLLGTVGTQYNVWIQENVLILLVIPSLSSSNNFLADRLPGLNSARRRFSKSSDYQRTTDLTSGSLQINYANHYANLGMTSSMIIIAQLLRGFLIEITVKNQ